MIIFQLVCVEGHAFEGWFQDGTAFQEQMECGLVQCPACGSYDVTQKLSTGGRVRGRKEAPMSPGGEAQAFLRALREVVETHFEDVGTEFTKTALRMHFGVEEGRNIRGITTDTEEQLLREEGVAFLKVPMTNPSTKNELQ